MGFRSSEGNGQFSGLSDPLKSKGITTLAFQAARKINNGDYETSASGGKAGITLNVPHRKKIPPYDATSRHNYSTSCSCSCRHQRVDSVQLQGEGVTQVTEPGYFRPPAAANSTRHQRKNPTE